jgi:hypothetical protein
MSLAEIDRQLNNPLAKTWALVLQITPVIKSPFM